ncbi:MAG: hypothetical protein IPG01_14525 [Chitinophagaceae bacterium]|nr:hypothetical protein [Chitinophagaceae bacterium]
MKKLWDNITENDVKKAVELFDRTNENYPEPRNTFLLYNDKNILQNTFGALFTL